MAVITYAASNIHCLLLRRFGTKGLSLRLECEGTGGASNAFLFALAERRTCLSNTIETEANSSNLTGFGD